MFLLLIFGDVLRCYSGRFTYKKMRFEKKMADEGFLEMIKKKQIELGIISEAKQTGEKMAESTSRYGIIEELNNRKINQKEKLANIERETDQKTYDYEKKIELLKKEIGSKEDSYEIEHKDKLRELKINARMLDQEYERESKKWKEKIDDEETGYQERFNKWKEQKERELTDLSEELDRYKKVQEVKISEKQDIIKEIESGIDDLKEVSKESKSDSKSK